MRAAQKKWRPSIAMVVAVVCISLISVPLLALLAVRLTSNQFVRETEQSLIHQGAIYSQLFSAAFAAENGPQIGTPLTEDQKQHWSADIHPARAQLNVHRDTVGETRPDGIPVTTPLDPRYVTITATLLEIARQARRTNLSGVVFLSHDGRAFNTADAPSHAALPDIQTALKGEIGARLRARKDDYDPHALSSLSRDTGFRVFVAYPVILDDHVIGAIHLSRTPLNLGKFLFQERYALLTMLASTVFGAALIGWLLIRLISRPIYALRDASHAVAAGKNPGTETISHFGLRELAKLGDSVSTMATTLSKRSQEISTYTDHVTHELKSPVTSIIGAAELLQSTTLSEQDHGKLLRNIEAEAVRMNQLLSQLRNMARAQVDPKGEAGRLSDMRPMIDGVDIVLHGASDLMVPLSTAHGKIILHHMIQNARAHGAHTIAVSYNTPVLRVTDDGEGVSKSHLTRVTEPFFTTRRDQGGTGMGLAIVQAILDNYGAELSCLAASSGAIFDIRFPEN